MPKNKKTIRITDFPHLEMTPDDIRELEERRRLDDDPAFIAGKEWAREQRLNAPVPGDPETHDEYIRVHRQIKDEARRRYPDDVVGENRFWEGARAWAGA